jgi:hypothetical protein
VLSNHFRTWRPGRDESLVLAALVGLLLVSRLFPPNGFGLWLRLIASTVLVLLPGLVIARKLALPLVSGGVTASLLLLTVALATVFIFRASLNVGLIIYAVAGSAAATLIRSTATARFRWRPHMFGAAIGLGLGALLWPVTRVLTGDALFHLARVRKLESFNALSLSSVVEFRHGGLHPGYAFPLWHGLLAFLARLSSVDPGAVVLHESSVLAAVAVLVAFEAGRAVFGSSSLGAAAAITQVVLTALAPGHGGAYVSLALPATAARQILVPATIAVAFSAVPNGAASKVEVRQRLPPLLALAAAALVLALTHVTYALFLGVVFAGCLVVRVLVDRADAVRLTIVFAFFGIATAAVVAWLAPLAASTRSQSPACTEIRRAFANYPGQILHASCSHYSLAPGVFARSGSIAVAALLLLPVAAITIRERSSSLIAGGSLTILACTLLPWVFPHFADLVSISQARRAAGFVPFALVLTAVAAVAGRRLGWWTLPLALGFGITLQLLYPGSFGASLSAGLPGYPAWIALIGGALAVAAAFVARVPFESSPSLVALAAIALFVAPVVVAGFFHWTPAQVTDRNALTPGVTQALAQGSLRGSVVFSDPATSYEVGAADPVYIATAPIAHVADTRANNPYGRRRDALRFLATGDLAIPRRYGACTILLHRPTRLRLRLSRLYADGRFVLYALPPVWRGGRCRLLAGRG